MSRTRLDQKMVILGLVPTRSQAESYVRLGEVKVNGKVITKPGALTADTDKIELTALVHYVSRAALKLVSASQKLKLNFKNKVVLDVGSSTGGFTEYALKHGAKKVIAVDVGTNQLHPSLRNDPRIELYERTDIREFKKTDDKIDLVLIDVSFISLRSILPALLNLILPKTQVVAMVKPQFEAGQSSLKHKGVIKNERVRRQILKSFEQWVRSSFIILDKVDSQVAGSKGNLERFYLLKAS